MPETLVDALRCTTVWTVREFRRKGSLLLREEVLRRKNVHTTVGLTAYASAFQGSYTPPQYLVIETLAGLIQNAGTLPLSSTSVQLNVAVDEAGDTSLVLGVGTGNQETVTFSGRTGTGPYTYTISATTKTHAHLDPCVRLVLTGDGMSQVQSEAQYDSVNAPGQRALSLGGYSQGSANWVMQFFLTGAQGLGVSGATLLWANVGLADNSAVGAGSLHNHLNLGYSHVQGNDVELDVSLTLANG
jgi:hypothetical protein